MLEVLQNLGFLEVLRNMEFPQVLQEVVPLALGQPLVVFIGVPLGMGIVALLAYRDVCK